MGSLLTYPYVRGGRWKVGEGGRGWRCPGCWDLRDYPESLQQDGVGAGVWLKWGDAMTDWGSHVAWGVVGARKLDPHPILGSFNRI